MNNINYILILSNILDMIALDSIFVIVKHFLPKSFREAPMEYNIFLSMMINLS